MYLWNQIRYNVIYQIRYNVTQGVNVISVVFLVVAIGLVLLAVSLTRVDLVARR